MALKLITPPTTVLVPLDEAKVFARVSSADDDVMVAQLVASAASRIYQLTNRQLMPAQWEVTLDAFPDGAVRLDVAPLLSVEFVRYYDADGMLLTLGTDQYYVDADSEPGWVVPLADVSWPATLRDSNVVRVGFTAGYAPAPAASGSSSGEDPYGNVPPELVLAAKMLVAHWYNFREVVVSGPFAPVPQTVVDLCQSHRVFI